jgi:hypothetical protein
MLQSYLGIGRPILVISAFGPNKPREDAFLCYVSARLAGLAWYSLNADPWDASVADLYRLNLGQPLTLELPGSASGVSFRVFERGLVAVNWTTTDANLIVQSPPIPATRFYAVFDKANIEVAAGGSLPVPTMSGRVYLFGSSTDFGLKQLI